MKAMLSSKGQGLIEAVLTLPLLMLIITSLTYLLYRGVVFNISDYHLHEALICAQSSSASTCKDELIVRLKPIVFNSKITASLNKFSNRTVGEIIVALNPPLTIKQTLKR